VKYPRAHQDPARGRSGPSARAYNAAGGNTTWNRRYEISLNLKSYDVFRAGQGRRAPPAPVGLFRPVRARNGNGGTEKEEAGKIVTDDEQRL